MNQRYRADCRPHFEPLGKLDQRAPVGRVRYLIECNDEPQTFNDAQIDLIFPSGRSSLSPEGPKSSVLTSKAPETSNKMPTREDDLRELATSLAAVIERAAD